MWYYRPVAELFPRDCGAVYDTATRSIERPFEGSADAAAPPRP
jgi:hypothetical protein